MLMGLNDKADFNKPARMMTRSLAIDDPIPPTDDEVSVPAGK